MGFTTSLNGYNIELGQTRPSGLGVGSYAPHRQLIQWNIPTRGLVEMYINPQSLSVSENKIIKETRTKGGYVIQYWGEQLPEIDIQGTTGSGGIEGINVLRDVYRQEQIGFNDVISQLNSGFLSNIFQTATDALQSLTNSPLSGAISSTVNSLANGVNSFSDVVTTVGNVANVFDSIGQAISTDQQLLPTLGALATSVELWYSGKIYRGFFKSFRVDEKSDEVGIFRYAIKFMVTRESGMRQNNFPWQRSVENGPANSDIIPLSFGALAFPSTGTAQPAPTAPALTIPSTSRRTLLTGG
jgi:hypothetical protein